MALTEMEDQLAYQVASVFSSAAAASFDQVVAQARERVVGRVQQAKREGFERLFDSQLAALKDRGCPDQIIEAFANGKAKVLDHAASVAIAEGNLAFAPVVTPLYLGYHGIVAMVRYGGKAGYTYLNPAAVTDVENVPAGLYYMFDVEDGRALLGKTPGNADGLIRGAKRLRSTTPEVVSLGTHTKVLSHHYVDAVGSRYDSDRALGLCVSGDRPRLYWNSLGNSVGLWGAASCGIRLEL